MPKLKNGMWGGMLAIGLAALLGGPAVAAEAPLRVAQATPATQPADLDKLIAAAKAEKSVTIYTAAVENAMARVIKGFNEKYGVNAQFVRMSSSVLQQRFSAEAAAGNIAADMIFIAGGPTVFLQDGMKNGSLQAISDAGIPVLASGQFPARFSDGKSAVIQISPWLIAVNTDKLSGPAPKDWPDILDPKYKGQIILIDPRASNAFLDIWAAILDKHGEEFFAKLRAQEPRRYADGIPATQGLAAGEAAIEVPALPAMVTQLSAKGAPLEQEVPAYTSGVEMHVIVANPAKSRSPNAARLLAHFVMSPEGNKLFNADPGSASVYDTSRLPAQYQAPKPETAARKEKILSLLGF